MNRRILAALLSLTAFLTTSGCTPTDDLAADEGTEFREVYLQFFGYFYMYVNVETCFDYFDAIGPELTADFHEIGTCTETTPIDDGGNGNNGLIIDLDPQAGPKASGVWALAGHGEVMVVSLDEDPCAASDPELCPWLTNAARLLEREAPALVEASPTGLGGLATAWVSPKGLYILPSLPELGQPGVAVQAALDCDEPAVSKPIVLGEFDEEHAVEIAVTIASEGLIGVIHPSLTLSSIPR